MWYHATVPIKDPEKRREYDRARRERIKADPELLEAKRKQAREAQARRMEDPEFRQIHYARVRKWNDKNRRWKREDRFRRRYGITIQDYERIHDEQGGVCRICGNPEKITDLRLEKIGRRTRRLAVDHDHRTGEIRGLLCYNCNTGLGLFRDDPFVLKAAIKYLVERT